jgi:type II secretory pathway component GspD/PulD (secretin)
MHRAVSTCIVAILLSAEFGAAKPAAAQQIAIEGFAAPSPAAMTPEQAKAMAEAQAKAAAAGQPQPGQPTPPGAQPAQPEQKPGDGYKKKEEAGADTIKRPDTPPKPPDPRELEVVLDKHGKVPPFNFIGQPWPDVMQWLANLSDASLDWQEYPNGYLNLTTQRSYSLDEVHDLINQALTARGFTSIKSGEMLSVFKIEKLDPSVVRQISEEDLYNLKRYDFVKVSFELPSEMEVEKAKEDVKQVLSPNAKVFPLVTTRRLLVIDTVANLRTVSELLNEERMFQDGRIVPEEFVLKHARPEHVMEILKTMVGNDAPAPPPMTPEQQQQQQQMIQQMQQRGQKPPQMPGQANAPKVYLAMNRRRNSILVNAPPEQLKIIKRTIEYLDVPSGEDGPVEAAGGGLRTLFKYQLVTMDPEQLKVTLEEIGELDPRTELRADTKSKILFARATAADHQKIAALRDELDGTGRGLRPIWLPRRLPADAVAGTIMALMGGQQDEEEENEYPYWYSYRQRDDDKPKKGFRVDADIENNRLLLWANEAEFKEVERFVAELSKSSPALEAQRAVRSIETDPEATARLLEQLKKAWPSLGENELIINDQRPKAETQPAEKEEPKEEKPAETGDRQAAANPAGGPRFYLAQLAAQTPAAEDLAVDAPESSTTAAEIAEDTDKNIAAAGGGDATTKRRAPVTVTVTEEGRILISSEDTEALDRLEQFVGQAAPQQQRYKIFRIRHADVYDVYLNLKEFYEDELKGERDSMLDWWGEIQDTGPKESLLSRRPPLRLIWDPDSNSILVANASPSQLAEIERLIKEYDQPQADDETTERVTRPVKVQYSRASVIVTSLKEVFRDLLSSKDKEFDAKDGQQRPGSSGGGITVLRYSMGGSDNDQSRSAPVKVGFQGALSLAADDVSNIVLVSAQKDVFELVNAMIQKLDQEAAPQTTVRVHRVTGSVSAESLQKALDQAVGKSWLGNRPEQTGTADQNNQQQNNDRRNRDRDGRRGRGDRRGDRDND